MPEDATGLWRLEAAEMARLVAEGSVSSRELVTSCLDRMDAINPIVNAVTEARREEALAAAEEADRRRARKERYGSLHGVPVLIKINIDQRGAATDNGVRTHRSLVAGQDNPVVANLKRAGAIIIGRTNAPAYSMRWFTDNELHGLTLNPWDASKTVGGSSGGTAAAVATGIAPIGHGNDIAGSIRYPAYCCGIVGLKPGYGRVPSFNATARGKGSIASQLMAVQGPLTRTVRDARLAFQAMARPSPDDPRTMIAAPEAEASHEKRAALVSFDGLGNADGTAAEAVAAAGRKLEAAGYAVEEVRPPLLEETVAAWPKIAVPDILALLAAPLLESGDRNGARAVELWRAAWPGYTARDCLDAVIGRHALLRSWLRLLEKWPILVMPVSLRPPFAIGSDTRDAAATAEIIAAQAPMMAVSVLGLPALSVPIRGTASMPGGVQIMAAPGREEACLAVGGLLEDATAPLTPIDPLFDRAAASQAAAVIGVRMP
ncbi:MAG: amidase [Rhizobiaceae bacterium]|nr:MAG: amidase [Rhizobiaceae bacterium]